MKGIIRFFIKEGKVINLVSIAIIIAGLYIFKEGQKEAFPNINLDVVSIQTLYPGASSKEVEVLVTDKIEDALKNIEGAEEITSRSVEGLSTVTYRVEPDYPYPIDKIVNEIKRQIDTISDFPEDVEDPIVTEINSDIFPVISVVMAGDITRNELQDLVDVFEEELEEIKGVSRVDKTGYLDEEIWVEIDPVKLKNYKLSIQDVVNAIRLRNINLPGGKVRLEQKEYLIRTIGQYKSIKEIKNTIIRANDIGNQVYLKNIAKVTWSYEKEDYYTQVEGSKGVYLRVYKKKSGDIIKVAKAVKKAVQEYKQKFKNDNSPIKVFTSDDLSYFVENRLNVLADNVAIGLVFILLCLLMFFDLKTAFWTTMGIPIAFCSAMIVITFLGITLNMMSMFGFIIVIGMIVDDAIVVGENIYRLKENGLASDLAAVNGTWQVIRPVMATVLTTICAFMPLAILPGTFGEFLGVVPVVVTVTMIASFLECFIILPGHVGEASFVDNILDRKDKIIRKGFKKLTYPLTFWRRKSSQNFFQSFQTLFIKIAKVFLWSPLLTIFLFASYLIVFTYFATKILPFIFFPGLADEFQITIKTKGDTLLEETGKVVNNLEESIRLEISEQIREIISTVGYVAGDIGNIVNANEAQVRIILEPERNISDDEIGKKARSVVEKFKESGDIEDFKVLERRGGPPAGKPIEIRIYNNSFSRLQEASDNLVQYLSTLSNVTSVETSLEDGKDELTLVIDERKASRMKININSTASFIRNAFDGSRATTINSMPEKEKDIDVIVKYDENKAKTYSKIKDIDLQVKNQNGQLVDIQLFSQFKKSTAPSVIYHEKAKRFVRVSGELLEKGNVEYTIASLNEQVDNYLNDVFSNQFPEIKYELAGEQETNAELQEGATIASIIAIVCIFLVLVGLFRSISQPFVIMLAIPFAAVGVLHGLMIHYSINRIFDLDMDISMFSINFMTFMGIVGLIGVVVNDSLIFVSFINKNRRLGVPLKEALINGIKMRLRPILLTTLTTVVGLAPFSYGIQGKEPILQPMGIAIIWGLSFATFVTLLILPCFYYIIEKIKEFLYRLFKIEYKMTITEEDEGLV